MTTLFVLLIPIAFLLGRFFTSAAGARAEARHHLRVAVRMRKAQLRYTLRTAAVALIALLLLIGYLQGGGH